MANIQAWVAMLMARPFLFRSVIGLRMRFVLRVWFLPVVSVLLRREFLHFVGQSADS